MSLIYNAAEIRAWDAFTIKNEPISSLDLMERAAIGCCKKIRGSYVFKSIAIVCGKGNNGGDGLAIGRLFSEAGYEVSIYILEYSPKASVDFSANLKRLPKKIRLNTIREGDPLNIKANLILDCLFGSGLDRPISGWLGQVVQLINKNPAPVVSIDIPSGLFVGSNASNDLKQVIRANRTLSFQIPKFPFFFEMYAAYIGKFSIIDIGLLENYKAEAMAVFVQKENVRLKPISHFAHKGHKGFLSIVAGSGNMLGAAILSAKAAFKTGCGYVGVIGPEKLTTPLTTVLPEAMWSGETAQNISNKTNALAIGPGLGTSPHALEMVAHVFGMNIPIVVDADALNLLAAHKTLIEALPKQAILTPHIGELNRLVGKAKTPEELLEKQRNFSQKHQVYIIQKGAYSKLTTPEGQLLINSTGNSAMASAGMGDALTGMIGAFLAQGYSPLDAAKSGMYYHGLAGDEAARKLGSRGLVTSDLIDFIPNVLNGL